MERRLIEAVALLSCALIYSFICWVEKDQFAIAKGLSFLILLTIYVFFRFQRPFLFFSPLNLFCLVYITIPITNFYYIHTDFNSAIFIDKYNLTNNYIDLFNKASFYYFIGLLSIILGYLSIKSPKFTAIVLEDNRKINSYILKGVMFLFLLIGTLNFIINVRIYGGGSLFLYMSNIAIRATEFGNNNGTTAGYLFYYMGTYLLVFHYMRTRKKINLFFIAIILFGVLIKASTGRIYGTLVYLLTFFAIYYYYNFLSLQKLSNIRYFLWLIPIPILGVSFYFFRVVSSLYIGTTTDIEISQLANGFLDLLGYYAIDKGNTPNIALFMKVIDTWKDDFGYLYGSSLLSGILPILNLDGYHGVSSVIVQNLWYKHLPSGALPTTAIGEMYMNFGPIGPFVGMFVVGVCMKLFYVFVVKSANYWNYIFLILISLTFFAIYPKVDFTNFSLFYLLQVYIPFFFTRVLTYILFSDRKHETDEYHKRKDGSFLI